MKCPNDSATLVMSERSGVEIDYCPECRGVWLDRGELDKIIERAEKEFTPTVNTAPPAQAQPQAGAWGSRSPQYGLPNDPNRGYDDRERGYDSNRDGYRRKKKESWLSDLFD